VLVRPLFDKVLIAIMRHDLVLVSPGCVMVFFMFVKPLFIKVLTVLVSPGCEMVLTALVSLGCVMVLTALVSTRSCKGADCACKSRLF